MEFIISEWGKHTPMANLVEGIKYCKKKKLLDGKEGLLWIKASSKREMIDWKKENDGIINHDYMYLLYTSKGSHIQYIWCSAFGRWEDFEEWKK